MDFSYTLGKLKISNRVSRAAAFKLICITLLCVHPKPYLPCIKRFLFLMKAMKSFVINSHGGIINFITSINEIFVNNTLFHNLSQELH